MAVGSDEFSVGAEAAGYHTPTHLMELLKEPLCKVVSVFAEIVTCHPISTPISDACSGT